LGFLSASISKYDSLKDIRRQVASISFAFASPNSTFAIDIVRLTPSRFSIYPNGAMLMNKKILIPLSLVFLAACGSPKAQDSKLQEHNLATAYIIPKEPVYLHERFETYADATFSAHDFAIIGPSAKKMHLLLNNPTKRNEVLDCAYRNSTMNLPISRTLIADQLVYVFANPIRPIRLHVARLWNEDPVAGRAPLGNGGTPGSCTNGAFPECGDLMRVALNADHLGSDSTFFLRHDTDYWAAVLAHEVLHNLGHNHPNGYPGSFITEFGNCVQSNLKGTSDYSSQQIPFLEM
jgi:hypothetical protein